MNEHVFAEQSDGLKFVGDFEALYAEDDDPWFQSGSRGAMADYYAFSRLRLVLALRERMPAWGLEIGCGHGHVTAQLQRSLGNPVAGLDVARAAVSAAAEEYPACRFFIGDITSREFKAPGRFGYVVWGQILWYVLHEIDVAVENTRRCIEPGGLFVVSQAFLRNQRYGRDIADGFAGALSMFTDMGLTLLEAKYDDSERFEHHDGLMVFRVA